MGGTVSKTAVTNLTELISNVASSTVQDCEVRSSQQQNLTVVNSGLDLFGWFRLSQKTDISSQCFSDVNKQTQLQNALIDTIAQYSTADGIAILGAFGSSYSEAVANLGNAIRTNITMSNIQRTYNEIKQSQNVTFINKGVRAFSAVDMTQGGQIFSAAVLKELDAAGILSRVETYIEQKSAADTQNPLSFITDMFNSTMWAVWLLVFVVIILVAAGIAWAMSGGGQPSDATTTTPATVLDPGI